MKPLPKSLHFGIAKSSENYVVAMPKIWMKALKHNSFIFEKELMKET
jgi:hypothetical protein